MIDHVSIKVKDVEQAKAFYEAALAPLGYARGVRSSPPSKPANHTLRRRWPPAARTTGRPARAITIRATTRRSCTTPKATTSRPSSTTGLSSRCRRRAVSRCAAPQVASRRSR